MRPEACSSELLICSAVTGRQQRVANGSVTTSAFVGTDPTECPQLPSGPSSNHNCQHKQSRAHQVVSDCSGIYAKVFFLRRFYPDSFTVQRIARPWCNFPWDYLKFSICHTLLVMLASAMTRDRPSGDWIAPSISGLPERSKTETFPSSVTFSKALTDS